MLSLGVFIEIEKVSINTSIRDFLRSRNMNMTSVTALDATGAQVDTYRLVRPLFPKLEIEDSPTHRALV